MQVLLQMKNFDEKCKIKLVKSIKLSSDDDG